MTPYTPEASNIKTPARTAKEQFDRQADHYNAQWNAWSEESLDWLRDHADARSEDVVLDVATGTGFTALAFAPRVRSVVGLDVSPGMLAKARQQAQEAGMANVTFQEGSAERLPFPNAAFDIVTCRIAAHHFLSVPQFLREAARVLKPGGRFLLADTTVPDDDPEADAWQNDVEARRDPSHVRCYTPREWRRFVEEAGYRFEQMDSAGGGIPIVMSRWLINAGCTPEQSDAVRRAFETAPAAAVRAFRIERLPDGDIRFVWQRAVLKAVWPSPATSPAG
jgi:ubiquinone/menaquinone biosynthesis C-methylase UbiE